MISNVIRHGNDGENSCNSHGNTSRSGPIVNPECHPTQDDNENARKEVTQEIEGEITEESKIQ